MKSKKAYQIILMTLFGMVGSIIIGFIFYRRSVFVPTNANFQFVMSALYGSLFFGLIEYNSFRDQIFGVIILFFMNLILFTGKHISISYITRDFFYLGCLFLSIKFYSYLIKRFSQLKYYLRSIILALIYGLSYGIVGWISFTLTKGELAPISFIYFIARYCILIGMGIGLGLDFFLQNKNQILSFLKIKTA